MIDEVQDFDNDFRYVVESEVEQLHNSMSKDDSPAGINVTPFTLDEVTIICNSLPNGKAPGADLLSYEHFKYSGNVCKSALAQLFNSIIKYVYIPPAFKEGLLITVYKGHGKPNSEKNSSSSLLPSNVQVFLWNISHRCLVM